MSSSAHLAFGGVVKALRVTLRRFARRALVALGAVAVGTLVMLGVALVYLQTAPGRRILAAKVSEWVSREIVADLRIERIDVLSNARLEISGATLFDAKGRPVLAVRGLSASLNAWTILRQAFAPVARVELGNVHLEQLELGLFRSETGGISLADAFASARPSENPVQTPASKGPRIQLPKVVIDRVTARTDFAGLTGAIAELRALNLNFDWSPELLSLGLVTADARVLRALPLDANGRLHADLRFPGTTDADFEGKLGNLPLHAVFRAKGDQLGLDLSSESLAPEAMRALFRGWPLVAPLSARVELSGPSTALVASLEARSGATRLDGKGSVALSPALKGDLSLAVHELDARLFAPAAAQTALDLDAKLEFALDPAVHVALNAHSAKANLFGVSLPETTVAAVYADNELTGTLTSVDSTLPATVDVHLTREGVLRFQARTADLDLAKLGSYGFRARGRAQLEANGELASAHLSAQFEARIRAFQLAPLLAQSTVVRGKVRGPIAQLDQFGVEVEAIGSKLSLGAAEFPVWAFESRGSLLRQSVAVRAGPESAPTLQGSTTLAFGRGVSLNDTRLEGEFNGVKHGVELKFASFGDDRVQLNGLHWQVGSGTLTGAALITPTQKRAEFELSGIPAEAISKTLGLDVDALRGELGASLDFEEDGGVRRGKLKAALIDGNVPGIGGIQAQFDASLVDSEIAGEGTLLAPQLGKGKLLVRGALARVPIGLQSLARTSGEVRLDLQDVELSEVSRRWLPAERVALSGFADASVRLAKREPSAPAVLSYELKTRELGWKSERATTKGTLLRGEVAARGEIGASETATRVELNDAAGPWISANIEHRLGLVDWVHVVRSSSLAEVLRAPVQTVIEVRPRSLELLGDAVPRALRGEVAAKVGITGSLQRPELAASLSATGLGGVGGPDASGQLLLNVDYSAAREEYAVKARYADRVRAKLEFEGGGRWTWVEHGLGRDWSARGEANIEKLELGPLAELLSVPLTGVAGGRLELNASSNEFEANGRLDLDRLTLERQALGRGSAQVRVHRGLAQAELQIAGAASTLEVSGEVGLCWAAGPCIDSKRGGSLDVKVRNYQLATLAPLLRSVASDIRGPVNGFATIGWDPADDAGNRTTRLRADAIVDGGSVILSGGAGSFQCAKLRALGEGTNTLNLSLSGCARSNRVNLWANADVAWNGLLPERVKAKLYTKDPAGKGKRSGEGGKLPVTFDGVVLGSATVYKAKPIQVTVELAGEQRAIEVTIPELEFELPVKDDTSLVDLSEDPAIVVTDAKMPPDSVSEVSESPPWKVSVRLGNAVTVTQGVTLTQPLMRVPVTGSLTQGPDGLLDGNIILPEGGFVPQLQQIFRLKRGSVRFNHQALKDGALNIEASTRTAEGVVVELFVSGTIEKPVIRLRSDPPRSENDIIALLLGVQGSDTVNSNGQQGADLRGSATALAMNQLLRGSVLAGFQFGAGQTNQGDSVSTVSMRASNTVWLEGRTVRSSTQRAQSNGVQSSGVIDWRFARGFSLRTQLGTISGLELRWSHRY